MTSGAIVAIVSDLHCNSRYGLCPPRVQLDNGGEYVASDEQRQVWALWREFWHRVAELKDAAALPVTAVINGEAADINRHSMTDPISHNPADALFIAGEALKPAFGVVDRWFVVRGTEAHSGADSHRDELIGHDIGAEQDPRGNYSWNVLRAEFGGVTFDIAHHPEANSRRPWTRGNAANTIAGIVQARYHSRRQWPPALVIRSHVHSPQDSGDNHATRAIVTPGWKLPDPFTYRIAGDELILGGLIVTCRAGEYSVEKIYKYRTPEYFVWKQTT